MSTESRLRLSERAVLSEFGVGGAVLLDLQTKQYLVLNATGGAVCRHLGSSGATVADVVAALCAQFEVPRADAERDVLSLLDELQREGLVCPS